MRVAAIKEAASRGHSRSASAGGLDGLAAASSPSAASAASNTGPGTPLSTASTTQQQQEGQVDGSAAPGGASHAEAAHMSSVNLEGLTPEASIAALQQLNYDLTMQLDLYQTMVTRLKDQMESVDTEKAELEADKVHLQQQLATLVGGVRGEGAAGARGFGSWWRGRSRRTATTTAAAAGVGEGPSEAGEEGEWDRSTVGGDETMSVAGSLRSTLSGDLDAPRDATPRDGPAAAGPADSGSSAPAASSSSDGPDAATASSSQPAGGGAVGAVGSMAAAAGRLVGRLSRGPSASGGGGPAAGAPNPEVLSRQLREARHQAQAVAEDNKVLVSKLVESQMELADAQGEWVVTVQTVVQFACTFMGVGGCWCWYGVLAAVAWVSPAHCSAAMRHLQCTPPVRKCWSLPHGWNCMKCVVAVPCLCVLCRGCHAVQARFGSSHGQGSGARHQGA